MTGSVFAIGLTGLNAAQAGLLVTSHNIANAGTAGYHRQSAVLTTPLPQNEGVGFIGKGVVVDTVRRAYSNFLDNSVLQSQSQQGYLQAFNDQITQVDNLLADPSAGLSPAVQDFFSGVQDVATNPAAVPSRQALISSGQALVSRFHVVQSRLADIQSGVNSQISDSVTTINGLSTQLATLNTQITAATTNASQPPNDLLDQRDQLVSQLNQLVRASVVKDTNGSYSVFIGAGQSLVLGNQSFQLVSQPSATDPQNNAVLLKTAGGALPIASKDLQGGQLGGLLDFQSNALETTQNQLGRVALVLAQSFNDQHKLGQDLNGNLGGNFFSVPAPAVNGSSLNQGTAVVSAAVSNAGALTASDYQLDFNAGSYTLRRISDNQTTAIAPGAFPTTIDGLTLNIASGAPTNGDSFLIQPTRYGARDIAVSISDPALIAAAAPLRTAAKTSNVGSATISAGTAVDTTNAAFATPGTLTPPVLIQFTSAVQYSVFDNTNPAAPVLLQGAVPYNPQGTNAVFPTAGGADYGYRIDLTGQASTGDAFTVGGNPGAVADNRNALLLASLQTKNTVAAGTTTFQGAYSQSVSAVGSQAREISVQLAAQNSLVEQTQLAQQSYSGVNLDEEAANLIKFQQAYQASAKVLQIASTLFNSILSLGQ